MNELDRIIKVCEDFRNIQNSVEYHYGWNPGEIIDTCKKLKALGLNWGDQIYYDDFNIVKGNYYLVNSKTKYVPDRDSYYIIWSNGNIGKYQFVTSNYYDDVEDEWREFKDTLLSYSPLDWDENHNKIVYNVENGKKVMADYDNICKKTREKIELKIKQKKLELMRTEFERLKSELGY